MLLQSPYYWDPIVGVIIFLILYIASSIGVIVLFKSGRIQRDDVWKYLAGVNIVILPLLVLSWLSYVGLFPVDIWDAIIRFIDAITP